jgi:transposase InsO family protein
MCDNYGIKAKPTTSHNPQVNAIIERVHKVVNDVLRSFDLENNHENLEEQEDNSFDYFLQSTVWSIRSTYHKTLQATPCQLLFGRDMIHNIAFREIWIEYKKENRTL